MRRQLCWTERMEDGVKREVRVSFHGKGVRWQWKRADEETWTYDGAPSEADWDTLDKHAQDWYVRHRLPREHVDRIARLRKESQA